MLVNCNSKPGSVLNGRSLLPVVKNQTLLALAFGAPLKPEGFTCHKVSAP